MSRDETPTTFTYTSTATVVTLLVPEDGVYYIKAAGSQGGLGEANSYGTDASQGGLGGQVAGDFALTQGQTLEIAVGAQGSAPSSFGGSFHVGGGGGGGATFIVLVTSFGNIVLEAAGGGGGGGFSQAGAATGGAGGLGFAGNGTGGASRGGGGGGAGLFGDGDNANSASSFTQPATGGGDLVDGLSAGNQGYTLRSINSGGGGGFGGGGGGGPGNSLGGGGGGYSGGDSGEGGTSYDASTAAGAVLTAGVQNGDGGVFISLECFAEGTAIATPLGYIRVEQLRPGDLVISYRRGPVPVRWVGRRTIDCTSHPAPHRIMPVRVRAGAFGYTRPVKDLLLSPDHSVFVEEVLIPVKVLMNGHNILQERVDVVTYWHVEVDEHDVLLAEGLPVESYMDAGSRRVFTGGPVKTLTPDFASRYWEAYGCAPLRVAGPEVDEVIARLSCCAAFNGDFPALPELDALGEPPVTESTRSG